LDILQNNFWDIKKIVVKFSTENIINYFAKLHFLTTSQKDGLDQKPFWNSFYLRFKKNGMQKHCIWPNAYSVLEKSEEKNWQSIV